MRTDVLLWTACISTAITISIASATAAPPHECAAEKPAATWYTRDYNGMADMMFKGIEIDARQASDHAGILWSYGNDPDLTWTSHAEQLNAVTVDVNDIGEKLCRLETIRGQLAPWQQHVIDRIAVATRLMADNAQDAIAFGNAKPDRLWFATYRHYLNNLYNETASLTQSVATAVKFAGVSHEDMSLKDKLGA